MNRNKMRKQLDRAMPDMLVQYWDGFSDTIKADMEEWFNYAASVWGRKYDNTTHEILFEQEYQIDYYRFKTVARVIEISRFTGYPEDVDVGALVAFPEPLGWRHRT
jgi:hypothetical protein